jgi:hypothetical protein
MSDARSLEAEIQGITGALRRPFDSGLTTLIVPLISLLIKTLRKSREPAAKSDR